MFEGLGLETKMRLADYNIKEGSNTLHLVCRPGEFMDISVFTDHTSSYFDMEVDSSDTVYRLKRMVQLRTGMPPCRQRLYWISTQLQMREDDCTSVPEVS